MSLSALAGTGEDKCRSRVDGVEGREDGVESRLKARVGRRRNKGGWLCVVGACRRHGRERWREEGLAEGDRERAASCAGFIRQRECCGSATVSTSTRGREIRESYDLFASLPAIVPCERAGRTQRERDVLLQVTHRRHLMASRISLRASASAIVDRLPANRIAGIRPPCPFHAARRQEQIAKILRQLLRCCPTRYFAR